eukprot:tig00000241_g21011.t1
MDETRNKWIKHALAWIVAAGVASVTVPLRLVSFPTREFRQGDFSVETLSDDTVPNWALIVGAGLGPPLVFLIYVRALNSARPGSGPRVLYVLLFAYALTIVWNLFMTELLKNTAGQIRPDWLGRCRLSPGAPADPAGAHNTGQCGGDANLLAEGRRSWPSGHASFAFSAATFLSLFLHAVHAPHAPAADGEEWHPFADAWRSFLILAPQALAGFVAASRLRDAKHGMTDILCGAALGAAIALYFFRHHAAPALSPREKAPSILVGRGPGGSAGAGTPDLEAGLVRPVAV